MNAYFCISEGGAFESIQKAANREAAAVMHVAEHLDEFMGIPDAESYDVKVSQIPPPQPITVSHGAVSAFLESIAMEDNEFETDGAPSTEGGK